MSRIIAIDYGKKRTGLAWSDSMKIIATGLGSFDTPDLEVKIKEIVANEDIELFLLGYPTHLDGTDTDSTQAVKNFEKKLNEWFPNIPVKRHDERFTSKQAMQTMIEGGIKKKQRANKQLINQVSAQIILQEYLNFV
jgi:putative holliday junction resolvase